MISFHTLHLQENDFKTEEYLMMNIKTNSRKTKKTEKERQSQLSDSKTVEYPRSE